MLISYNLFRKTATAMWSLYMETLAGSQSCIQSIVDENILWCLIVLSLGNLLPTQPSLFSQIPLYPILSRVPRL